MGLMSGKLQFKWTRLYWIIKEFNGSYQLGTLVGDVFNKWVNRFQLKLYKGPMPTNPFKDQDNQDFGDRRAASTGGRVDDPTEGLIGVGGIDNTRSWRVDHVV